MFDMNYEKIFSFFVLFILKETLSSESTHFSSQSNITKHLDKWFEKIFQVELDVANEVREAFGSSEYYRLADFEYNLNHEVKPFENKFIFQDVNFYRHRKDDRETSKISQMRFNFLENKISITIKKLRITLEAELRVRYDTPYVTLFTTLNFRNFKLSPRRQSKNNNRISIDMSYDNFFVLHYGLHEDIHWSGEQFLLSSERENLTKEVTPAIAVMLRDHINRNHQFTRAFDTLFQTFSNINKNPDIPNREQQKYYYHIPQVPFYRFTLKNIRIQGLTNIRSLDVSKKSHPFTHTLLVEDIRGSMTLDYGSVRGAPEPLEMTFKADYFTISIHEEKNCAHVEAKYYSVNSTTTEPLTYRQTTTVMQRIESAILSSLIPSKKEWTLCNIKTPIDKQNISHTSDWNTIYEECKDWIPFKKAKSSSRSKTT